MKAIINKVTGLLQQPQLIKSAMLLVVTVLLMINHLHAQTSDPGEDPDVPIDGGLSLLVAAGVGYGAKKMKERKSKVE